MASDEVRVFSVDLHQPAAVAARLTRSLPPNEAEGSTAVRVARGALRIVLGDALGIEPAGVDISRRCAHCGHDTHGRPTVVGDPASPISFSLSHSGDFAVIALAGAGVRVGVDVEEVRPRRRLDALAARVLSGPDHAVWREIDDADERLRAFLSAWTEKEAYLKAIGIGIATRLRDVPTSVAGWSMCALDVGAGRRAALAVDRTPVVVRRLVVSSLAMSSGGTER